MPTAFKPQLIADGLRLLADWFDAVYDDGGTSDEVQQDLRHWATELEQLEGAHETEASESAR